MPQMGVSVSEGTVVEWRKRVGDEVARDETICEISTDKIDTEVPSPAAGRVAEILVEAGTTVDVGTVLARLAAPGGADVPTSEASAATGETPAAATASPAPEPQAAVPDDAPRPGRGATRATPVVARIAAEHGIDLSTVKGSGRGGRVRKQDVLALVDGDGP